MHEAANDSGNHEADTVSAYLFHKRLRNEVKYFDDFKGYHARIFSHTKSDRLALLNKTLSNLYERIYAFKAFDSYVYS